MGEPQRAAAGTVIRQDLERFESVLLGCAQRLDDDEVERAAVFFDRLPDERAQALAAGLFGLYTDPASADDQGQRPDPVAGALAVPGRSCAPRVRDEVRALCRQR